MQLTKAQQHSIARLQQAIQTIEQLVPLERKRTSVQRRKQLENAHEVFSVHCPKLQIEVPRLSTFYNEEEFLAHARMVARQIQQITATHSTHAE